MNHKERSIWAVIGSILFAVLLVFVLSIMGCSQDKPTPPPGLGEKAANAAGGLEENLKAARHEMEQIK